MCRWFAYISPTEPTLLSDVLLTPANAITKQCSEHYLPGLLPHGQERDLDHIGDELMRMRNSLLNMDGLGIAWYTDTSSAYTKGKEGRRPALYKSQSPPTNDFNFTSLCENTESNCVFAHIRASSGATVAPVNCHPFVFGRHAFMHNGVVSDFTRIRRDLSDYMSYDCYANIKGSTDSEHAAALYMTYLTESTLAGNGESEKEGSGRRAWEKEYRMEEMKEALQRTVITIMRLQRKLLTTKSVGGGTMRANSLNFCATDGQKMVACRFRNHETEQPPSLYWSEFAGTTLNRKYPGHPDGPMAAAEKDEEETNQDEVESQRIGKHTIIASEPTTYDRKEWHLIGKNHMLLVDENGIETEIPLVFDDVLVVKA